MPANRELDIVDEAEKAPAVPLSTFRPWFKIKVRDTLKPKFSATLSLFDIDEGGFDQIQEGERLRILDAQTPSVRNGNPDGGEVHLHLTRKSKVLNMTQLQHKPLKQVKIMKKHR